MATAPSITWYQYTQGTSTTNIGNANVPIATASSISGNVVDFDAVQAGNYSNVICVRPQFVTGSNNVTTNIGKVRFWWSDIQATSPESNSNVNLPNSGWVMKYYVSNCDNGLYSTSGSSDSNRSNIQLANVYRMLTIFNSEEFGKTSRSGNGANSDTSSPAGYSTSVWQTTSDNNRGVYMQPIPILNSNVWSGASTENQILSNSTTGYGSSWPSVIFGIQSATETAARVELLKYAVGGGLNITGQGCNIADAVSSNDDFPFIFLSIRPQAQASAGTWSQFSCRMSFIWPYTPSSN